MKSIIKKNYISRLLIAGILLVYAGCKQLYTPPVSSANVNYLVVEGIINAGNDSTIIRLSRTQKLTDNGVKPELNAVVSIESDGNALYQLQENGQGYYVTAGLNLNPSSKYRLSIVTSNSNTYKSDFVVVKNSPPIDSVGYEIKSNGVQFYTNTHDATNNTRYYRWDYTETWVIYSKYPSILEAVTSPKDTIIYRPTEDQITTCWISGKSTTIYLNSSISLSQDVISHNAIGFISSASEKFTQEYSVLVHQYALTKEAYDYWQNLKKNTEQLGSIFDAQPSEIAGNIHSASNPNEPVIGYISAGSVAQKRIFIGASSLPLSWLSGIRDAAPYGSCSIDSLFYSDPTTKQNTVKTLFNGSLIPITTIPDPLTSPPVGYKASIPFCVDCTLRGTNKKPSFWINKF